MTVDLTRLYYRLPTGLQNVACTAEGWRVARRRYGGEFERLLREAEERAAWPDERLREFRDARLRAFVRHAAVTVPFYRRRFRELGISPDEIRCLDDLAELPVLTRAEVQDHQAELVSEAVSARRHLERWTGGTTGSALRYVTTLEAVQEQWAVWWRWWRWHGLEQGTWCGYFAGLTPVGLATGRPPYWRVNLAGRQVRFSPYHLRGDASRLYVEELRRRRLPWIHGWPSALSVLATAVVETGIDLDGSVRWVTCGSENLLPGESALLERAFGVRPREHYGMSEAIGNASECELGSLHVDEDFAALELVPDPERESFRVVGTNFTNPAFPLLRYEVGDMATFAEGSCACGRPGRILASLDGRMDDWLLLPNGRRVGMEFVFRATPNVREAQVHQARLDRLHVRIIPAPGYTEGDAAALLRRMRRRIGEEPEVTIELVDTLPRSPSGKLRLVTTDIPEGRFEQAPRLAHASASRKLKRRL